MRRGLGLAAVIVAMTMSVAGHAQAAPALPIAPGQQLSFQIGSKTGDITIIAVARAAMTPFDIEATRQVMGIPIPAAPVTQGTEFHAGIPAAAVTPGQVSVRMVAVGERATVLILENGYDRGMIYHAQMVVAGKNSATDVCIVPGGKRIYEHWPFLIERLDLSGFTLVPWKPGDPIPCA